MEFVDYLLVDMLNLQADIEFITISTLGNSQDFGDLTDVNSLATTNDRTRGFASGGNVPTTRENDFVLASLEIQLMVVI